MEYYKTLLSEEFIVNKIVTIHYFEYARDYVFTGEKHNFWEIVYVDKGELEIMADKTGYKLSQGEMVFHQPNEFHNIWANGKIAPNLIIVSFECKSKAMNYFKGKIVKTDANEVMILADIINEAKNAFSSPLDDTFLAKLDKNSNPVFGSEQIIKTDIERLLIYLYRRGESVNKTNKISAITKQRYDIEVVSKIEEYLVSNIYKNLSFIDVCQYMNMSSTKIKVLFKSVKGTGVMEFFNKMKILEATRMIREDSKNFTEIAQILDYTSVHYFSRYFKKVTGMTPTQYSTSIKAKSKF